MRKGKTYAQLNINNISPCSHKYCYFLNFLYNFTLLRFMT